MNPMRLGPLALGAMLLGMPPAVARADWPVSPLVNVPVCTAPGGQTVRRVISDERGGMIAVWLDSRSGNDDIYAQHLNAAGTAMWAANGVPVCAASAAQEWPHAVPDGAGGAFIVWQDARAGANPDIYAQHVDAAGTMLWATDGVPLCTVAAMKIAPKLVQDGAGGVVVVWCDSRTSGSWNFFAQRVASDGTPRWIADGVRLTTGFPGFLEPQVAAADSGGVIVAWTPFNGVSQRARAQRVDDQGQLRWGDNGTSLANVSTQTDPVLVADGQGGAIVAWADYRAGNGLTTSTFAQRVDASGAPLWASDGTAVAPPIGNQLYQAIVPDGVGGAVVAWSNDSTTAILAQRVSGSGVRLWAPAGVQLCPGLREHYFPFPVQSDGAGGLLAAWMDYRNGDGDLFVQRINASGAPVWIMNGVAASTAPGGQTGAFLIPDGAGGALVAWTDFRTGAQVDVYAQNVAANGTLGGSTLAVPAAFAPTSLSIRCARIHGARGAIEVDCALAVRGKASVGLFDLAGRCVERQEILAKAAGTQRVILNDEGRARSPGIYFVRLAQGDQSAVTRLVLVP